MIDFDKFEVLTFDCYGTLIDWEDGIANALLPFLQRHGISLDREQVLQIYAEIEPEVEQAHYVKYREVLRSIVRRFAVRFDFDLNNSELDLLADSIRNWQPFPDTVESLKRLHRKYMLAIISNIDDDLFAGSAKHLEMKFDWVVTAEQAREYKPSLKVFEYAHSVIGVRKDKILHVAQSLFHDIAPANKLGMACVWVNRRRGVSGSGATPEASAKPDLETPDLKTLADLIPGV